MDESIDDLCSQANSTNSFATKEGDINMDEPIDATSSYYRKVDVTTTPPPIPSFDINKEMFDDDNSSISTKDESNDRNTNNIPDIVISFDPNLE